MHYLTVKRDAKCLTRYVKGVPFLNKRVFERGTLSVKNGILKGKGISLTVLKFVC